MAFKESVYIDAPVETVFDITTDFEHAPSIMETVIRTEKLTEGPMQEGTQVKEVRNVRAREIETILTVSEYVPHQNYTVTSESAGMTVEYRYAFTAKEGGTTIDFMGSVQSKRLKNVLIRPIFERILKREDKDHLVRLKDYIEQQKTV